jgi:hypothetical protein
MDHALLRDKGCRVFVRFRAASQKRIMERLSRHHTQNTSSCRQFFCANDATRTPILSLHPEGYELNPEITKDSKIEYDQNKAFENADFIYTKTGAVTRLR